MKPSENQSRSEAVQENKLSEDDLVTVCRDIWTSYIKGMYVSGLALDFL